MTEVTVTRQTEQTPAPAPAPAPAADPAPAPAAAEVPSWLPEKFVRKGADGSFDLAASTQALAESYSNLEKGKAPPAADPANEADPSTAAASDALKAGGLSLGDFQKEYAESGTLSEESYTKLAAAGFDKGLVDQWIEGQKAIAATKDKAVEDFRNTATAPAGGPDGYAKLVEWAASSLPKEDIEGFNRRISTNNAEDAKAAVEWLVAKRAEVEGVEPKTVLNGDVTVQTGDVFTSWAEVKEAMSRRDANGRKLYGRDSEYSAAVQAKLGRSKL